MRLTKFTDYSLRVLLLAAARPGERITIENAADVFQISHAHLKKVVFRLVKTGFLHSVRGRSGGFVLVGAPADINLGQVVRATEPDYGLFECFLPGNQCILSRPCSLPNIANEALNAFLAVFDRFTLADAMVRPEYFLEPSPKSGKPLPMRGPRMDQAQVSPQKGTLVT